MSMRGGGMGNMSMGSGNPMNMNNFGMNNNWVIRHKFLVYSLQASRRVPTVERWVRPVYFSHALAQIIINNYSEV
jgi:hypothetical protein